MKASLTRVDGVRGRVVGLLMTLLLLLIVVGDVQALSAFRPPTTTTRPSSSTSATTTTTGSSSSNTKYYSYKTFKKLGVPALAYSLVSKAAARMLRLRPKKIPVEDSGSGSSTGNKRRRKVAIVTGSNTGVGFETAKTLVQDFGMEVVIACRSTEKGVQAYQEMNQAALVVNPRRGNGGGMAVFVQPVDLANLTSVRQFAQAIQSQYETIDVLINNAGRNSAGGGGAAVASEEGDGDLDTVFTTNFLGHFLLTNLLLDKCRRIVNLASVMHHFPNYAKDDDDNISSRDYWRNVAIEPTTLQEGTTVVRKTYGPSKLAALLFSIELNRRYGESKGIRSIAVNPGAVNSDIWRNYPAYMRKLYRLFYLTSQQGSSTSVAAAVMEEGLSPETVYLQPYQLPFQRRTKQRTKQQPPFPLFEMLGPYVGYVETPPRLPDDGGIQACNSLFSVCEELSGCKFETSSNSGSALYKN